MLALSAVFFVLPLLTITPPMFASVAPVAALATPALALKAAPGAAQPGAAQPGAAQPAAAQPAVVPPTEAGWWRDDVVYQIFVRSFADSDGDGIGDFPGLTARLDYLNDGDPKTDTDLGVDAIWLMPIHASPSYHGYDVVDYRSINPDYGTMQDFDRFLAAANQRGIRVIIDFVMNHSAKDHPWFQDAMKGPESPHRSRYLWRDSDPGWTQPWGKNAVWHKTGSGYYYGLFWGGMPDLNLGDPAVKADLLAAMRFWLDRGVAGFRLDAIRHLFESPDGTLVDLPESHAFLRSVRAELTRTHPHVLLVGEAWTDTETVATYYGKGDELHLAFGFQTAGSMIEAARDGVRSTFNQAQTTAKAFADRNFEAPFLANHDMPRTMRQLGGDAAAMRVAAAMLFAQPGTPFVYYGEEIGMQGGPSGKDEDKRTPMRWRFEGGHGAGPGFTTAAKPWHDAPEAMGVSVADQRGKAGTLWTLYRDLIALRRAHPALADGAAEQPQSSGGGRGFTTLLRTENGGGGQRVLAIYNVHTDPSTAATVKVAGAPTVLMSEGLDGAIAREGDGLKIPPLAPRGFAFVRLD